MRSRRRKRNVQISPPLAASSGTTRGYDKIIFVVIVNEYGIDGRIYAHMYIRALLLSHETPDSYTRYD